MTPERIRDVLAECRTVDDLAKLRDAAETRIAQALMGGERPSSPVRLGLASLRSAQLAGPMRPGSLPLPAGAVPLVEAVADVLERRWTPEQSSNVRRMVYTAATKELLVDFERSSYRYRFRGVPADVARGLQTAPSPGTYFAVNIKGQYEFDPVPVNVPVIPSPDAQGA